jgi:hypothetical protein
MYTLSVVGLARPRNSLFTFFQCVGSFRLLGLGLVVLAFLLLPLLKALPYSSCRLISVSQEELRRPPTPDFSVGPLSWPVSRLKSEPTLAPFRESLHAACGDATGVEAATCAAEALARRSPFGQPSTEFVDRDFDPLKHFKQHMAGEPGHCLTRSAIVATELLAAGIPARVVQLVPRRGQGHTVVGVWAAASGWTLVDPTYGGIISGPQDESSSADLLENPGRATWRPLRSRLFVPSTTEGRQRFVRRALRGNLVYPEPWLYLRLGKKLAPWPFRGKYVHTGPTILALGPAQGILLWGIPSLALMGVGLIGLGWRRPAMVGAGAQLSVAGDVRPLGDPTTVPPP